MTQCQSYEPRLITEAAGARRCTEQADIVAVYHCTAGHDDEHYYCNKHAADVRMEIQVETGRRWACARHTQGCWGTPRLTRMSSIRSEGRFGPSPIPPPRYGRAG